MIHVHAGQVKKLILVDAQGFAEGVGPMRSLPKLLAHAGVNSGSSLHLAQLRLPCSCSKIFSPFSTDHSSRCSSRERERGDARLLCRCTGARIHLHAALPFHDMWQVSIPIQSHIHLPRPKNHPPTAMVISPASEFESTNLWHSR